MRLHKITLLAVFLNCIANVSIWAQNTEPNFEVEFTGNTVGDYFKDYSIGGSTLSLSTTFTSMSASSGDAYLQIGNNAGSDVSTHHVAFKNDKYSIDSIAIYMSGNGADRDVQPVFLGWKEGCGTRTDCDIVNTSITHSSTAGTKASGTWYTFTFDKDDVKELRLYRRVKVVVNGASAVEYGNNQSVRIWGVKVWLKPTAPSITSFTVNGIEATIEGNNIFAELPFGTSLASLEPTITLGGTATSYTPTGAQDFSNSATTPLVYKAIDGVNADVEYNVTLTAMQAASNDATLESINFNGKEIEPETIMFDTIAYAITNPSFPLVITPNDEQSLITVSTDDNANTVSGIYSTTVNNPTPGNDVDVVITVTPQSGAADAVTYTLKIHRKVANTTALVSSITATAPNGATNRINGESFILSNDVYGNDVYPTITAVISDNGTYTTERNGDIETITYYSEADNATPLGTYSFQYIRQSVLNLTANQAHDAITLMGSDATWKAMVGNCYSGNDGSDDPYIAYDVTGWAPKNADNYWVGLRPSDSTSAANIRYTTFRVTNCKQVDILAFSRSSSNGVRLTVSNEDDSTDQTTSITSEVKVMSTLSAADLDPTKVYCVTVEGTGQGGNGAFAQLRLTAAEGTDTGITETVETGLSYYNGIIYNSNGLAIQVFNSIGKMVVSGTSNIDMNQMPSGLYIVRSNVSVLKIVK